MEAILGGKMDRAGEHRTEGWMKEKGKFGEKERKASWEKQYPLSHS
jgi:hypothetical protein